MFCNAYWFVLFDAAGCFDGTAGRSGGTAKCFDVTAGRFDVTAGRFDGTAARFDGTAAVVFFGAWGLDFRVFVPCQESGSRKLISWSSGLFLGQNRSGSLFVCPGVGFSRFLHLVRKVAPKN